MDRRWFPARVCKRDDKMGTWPCTPWGQDSNVKSPEPATTSFAKTSDPLLNKLSPSLVLVNFDMPYSVSGITERSYYGTGLIVDAERGITADVELLLEGLNEVPHPKVLALNKIDLLKREKLLALSADLNARVAFERTFMISALTGDGVKDFLDWAAERIPPGPWHFPEDQLTDLTLALTAAEVTREKLFLRVHDEIPYNSTVETEKFTVNKDGSYRIDQVIYVTRDTHKKIVLGEGGRTIKAIGADARAELMDIFETTVHLFLFVKVREKWGEDPERYREMGLEYPRR